MSTVQLAESLIAPVLEESGVSLWDVRFEKEGANWYLRYFLDKDGGITIQDCESVSRKIDKILDEADPIAHSYILEVGSPGIERELVKDWHFEKHMGDIVNVRFIRPVDGVRDFMGVLTETDGDNITIILDEDTEMTFAKKETAYIRLYVDFEIGGLDG